MALKLRLLSLRSSCVRVVRKHALRVAPIGVAGLMGAHFAESPTSIPLMIAVTLAVQMLVVAERAQDFGVPVT
jgi:hypothetical protein